MTQLTQSLQIVARALRNAARVSGAQSVSLSVSQIGRWELRAEHCLVDSTEWQVVEKGWIDPNKFDETPPTDKHLHDLTAKAAEESGR